MTFTPPRQDNLNPLNYIQLTHSRQNTSSAFLIVYHYESVFYYSFTGHENGRL